MLRDEKPTVYTDDLAHEAARLLRLAGFVLHCASRKTEACYYKWPGRKALIRVATHGKSKRAQISSDVVAALTFKGRHCDDPNTMRLHSQKFELMVWQAIGRYMIKAAEFESSAMEQPAATSGHGVSSAHDRERAEQSRSLCLRALDAPADL